MALIARAGAFRIGWTKLFCYALFGLLASSCCSDESFSSPAETEPIVVDAGPDQTVVVGATVSLTGSNNGNTASHKWVFFSKPAESASEIQDELSLSGASFVADVVGQYEIELIGATSSNPDAPDINPAARDTVVITAEPSIRFAPSSTTRVGIEDGRLKLIQAGGLVDIGPLFPGGAGDGDEIRQLAYDWTTHVLYGANVGRDSDFPSRRLFTIDLCTGEATEVGELRRPDGETFFLMEGLAVDSAGQIYVTGNLSDVLRSTTLLTVSIDGGVTTEAVGDMGTTVDGIDGGGDADRLFAAGERLFISDSFPRNDDMMPPFDTWLYEVDPSDPPMTVDLNPQGISAELDSLAWDPLSDWVEAIDWSTGSWYKVNMEGGFAYLLSGLPPIDGPFAFVDRGCGDQPCFHPVILTETFELGDSFDATAVPTNGASDLAGLEQAGGTPGRYRRMEHVLPGVAGGSAIQVFHLFDQEYDPANGAITHFNYSEDRIQFDPPFPSAVIGGGFFVVQNGVRYTFPLTSGGTFASLSWERARIDDLGETSFADGLDFSENGAPIQFGFYRSNSHGESSQAITTTHGIDNWRVEICRAPPPCDVEAPAGAIFGVARDEAGQVIEGMRVAANPISGRGQRALAETDGQGEYTMALCDVQTYQMSAQVVVGSRYMSTDGTDEVTVGLEGSVKYDIDAKRGYFLDATLRGAPVAASPGATVELTIDYRAWGRVGCPGCSYRMLIGFEESYAGYAELGNGTYDETGGGNEGTAVISVAAPSTPGAYGIYARLDPGPLVDAQAVYESSFPDEKAFIELGTLSVVP